MCWDRGPAGPSTVFSYLTEGPSFTSFRPRVGVTSWGRSCPVEEVTKRELTRESLSVLTGVRLAPRHLSSPPSTTHPLNRMNDIPHPHLSVPTFRTKRSSTDFRKCHQTCPFPPQVRVPGVSSHHSGSLLPGSVPLEPPLPSCQSGLIPPAPSETLRRQPPGHRRLSKRKVQSR